MGTKKNTNPSKNYLEFENIYTSDSMIWIEDRKKLNEYVIEKSHQPFLRIDFSYHIGQVFIQYDEFGKVDSQTKIISEVVFDEISIDHNPRFKYFTIYVMEISDWINERLYEVIDDIIKYGYTKKLKVELKDLRKFKNEIDSAYTSIFENYESRIDYIHNVINRYFSLNA
jgi:type III secretion system FlhB-like substrate exporter